MGLSANELRIGNYVIHEATTHKIISLQRFSCESEWVDSRLDKDVYFHKHYTGIEPIPLTEEWLLKFGFMRNHIDHFESGILSVSLFIQTEPTTIIRIGDNAILLNEIKYVHQLQNLFYSLCGEELTIK